MNTLSRGKVSMRGLAYGCSTAGSGSSDEVKLASVDAFANPSHTISVLQLLPGTRITFCARNVLSDDNTQPAAGLCNCCRSRGQNKGVRSQEKSSACAKAKPDESVSEKNTEPG